MFLYYYFSCSAVCSVCWCMWSCILWQQLKGHVTIGLNISPQSPGTLYCSVYIYILLNFLVHYYDCDPWQPGVLLRACEEIKASLSASQPAKHQFSLTHWAETEILNSTVLDQSKAGEGCFFPSKKKVTGKTVLLCSSSLPPSVGRWTVARQYSHLQSWNHRIGTFFPPFTHKNKQYQKG